MIIDNRDDEPNKVVLSTYQDGATVAFTYDQHDNLTGMQDSSGSATYAYDDVKRLTNSTANGFTVAYGYDEAGNLIRLTYPGNRVVRYGYDALNRLERVTIEWLGRTAYYQYDDAGRLIGLTQFNGTAAAYTYDNANRLTDLENRTAPTGTVIAAYHFTLDANGNRVHVAHQSPLALTADATELTLGYNPQRNRLLSAGTTSFAYDDEGQLSTKAQATYTFDSAHRLTRISGTSNDQFVYDGAGTRLSAQRNGTVTRYIHDAAGNLLAEANGSTITRYYIHGKGLLALVTNANALYCYHFDATGHTVALTNASRTVVNRYAYTPFGNANQVESIAQPFKYVGQYGVMTEPNGLYYMRARYYDPQVGRFISEDPIGFDGGDVNLYAYVQNNPVMFIDPLGLWPPSNSQDNNVINSMNYFHQNGKLPEVDLQPVLNDIAAAADSYFNRPLEDRIADATRYTQSYGRAFFEGLTYTPLQHFISNEDYNGMGAVINNTPPSLSGYIVDYVAIKMNPNQSRCP